MREKFNDTWIKYLLKKLDNMGMGDSTLFTLVSDHGEEFFEHGCWEHGHSLCEEMLRVSFIMRCSGMVPRGVTIDHPVATVDMVPNGLTLFDEHSIFLIVVAIIILINRVLKP